MRIKRRGAPPLRKLMGIWILGWHIPRISRILGRDWEGYDLELFFIYKNHPYYSLSSHLVYIWDTSGIGYWSGVVMGVIIVLALAISDIRGSHIIRESPENDTP